MEVVKWIIVVLAIVLLVCSIILIVDNEQKKEQKAIEEDEFGEWSIEELPTINTTGRLSRKSISGDFDSFTLPTLGSDSYIRFMLDVPTCDKGGNTKYTICAKEKYYSFIVKTDPLGHEYSEVEYTWNEDNTKCKAKRVCTKNNEHVEEIEGNVIKEVINEANCSTNSSTKYMAIFPYDWAKTQIKIVNGEDSMENMHEYDIRYVWNEDHSRCVVKKECKYNSEHNEEYASSRVIADVVEVPTFASEGTIRFCPVFSEDSLVTFEEVKIPSLNDSGYVLTNTIEKPGAYKVGKGSYSYFLNGINYTFDSEIKRQDLYYYFDHNYYNSYGGYLAYDGTEQNVVDEKIQNLKANNLKVYNNNELRDLINNYNEQNEIKLKYNAVNKNGKLSEIVCNIILNASYDVQVIAYISEGTLNLFTNNSILISNNVKQLKMDLEKEFKKINYNDMMIEINEDTLLVVDDLACNYVNFSMIDEIDFKDSGEVFSKDGRFLIDLQNFTSTYIIPDNVEYVLASALESEANNVSIADSVKYIGNYALSYLGKVTSSEGSLLEYIGEEGLYKVENVALANFSHLKFIGVKAFFDVKLMDMNLLAVEHIGDEAFSSLSEDNVVIKIYTPMSLIEMGKNVFINRMNLEIHMKGEVYPEWGTSWNNVNQDGTKKATIIKEM